MKQSLDDPKLADKVSEDDKAAVKSKVDETLTWLDSNQTAEKDEFELRRKELEAVVNPIMTKLHAAGTPSASGGPSTCSQDAGPGFSTNTNPTVEEVD